MKKTLFILLLIISLLLTGCHGTLKEADASPDATDTETDTDGNTEPAEAHVSPVPEKFDESKNYSITFWAKNDTNKTQVAIYQKAIADFEALYPNVKVNLRLYTDYGTIYNDVITNIATGTTPNVAITYPDHIATYLTGNDIVTNLDDFYTDERYGLGGSELRFDSPTMDEVVPEFLAECMLDGSYYAVPYMRSTEACYVNKTYVEKLGFTLPETLTWDFVWEVSEAAVEKDSDGVFLINGQKTMIPFIYKSTDNMMIQMLRQKGAGYSTDRGEVQIFNDTTRELLLDIYSHAATRAFSTFKISSYPANFLNAGQCIFAVDSTAGATWMGSDAPLVDIAPENLVEFETVVMPIPQFDPSNPKMISQGPSVCIFNKADPQEVLASWLFAQFLLTNGVQTAYAETEGYVPVTLKAQNSPEYLDYLSRSGEDAEHYAVKIAASKLLMENTENTFTTPVFNGSTSLRDAAGQMIESVTKSARRKQTVDDAYIDKLFSDMKKEYHLDQITVKPAVTVDDGSGEAQPSGDNAGAAVTDPAIGPLPSGAVALIVAVAVLWVLIGGYNLWLLIKHKKEKRP